MSIEIIYEWFFYLVLPVLGAIVRLGPPLPYLLIGCVGISYGYIYALEMHHLAAFGGGIFAAIATRFNSVRLIALSKIASPVVMLCFVELVVLFPTAYGYDQLIIISIAFTMIAGGCNIYNLLSNRISKTLGEMAYSIYLLHGIILFTVIDLILGVKTVTEMSPFFYWLLIFSITPLLIGISFVTFSRIERPLMNQGSNINNWLHYRFNGKCRSDIVSATK